MTFEEEWSAVPRSGDQTCKCGLKYSCKSSLKRHILRYEESHVASGFYTTEQIAVIKGTQRAQTEPPATPVTASVLQLRTPLTGAEERVAALAQVVEAYAAGGAEVWSAGGESSGGAGRRRPSCFFSPTEDDNGYSSSSSSSGIASNDGALPPSSPGGSFSGVGGLSSGDASDVEEWESYGESCTTAEDQSCAAGGMGEAGRDASPSASLSDEPVLLVDFRRREEERWMDTFEERYRPFKVWLLLVN